jgi:hypothetical protein
MIAATRLLPLPDRSASTRWVAAGAVLVALGAAVGLRWLAARAGVDPLTLGALFGLALIGLARVGLVVAGTPPTARDRGERRGSVAWHVLATGIGVLVGLLLVGLTVAGPALAGFTLAPGLGRPAAPFVPWAAITILVATAEEVLLRGVLLDRLRHASGTAVAILVTSAVFALMHVPLYGWHVVPLNLAVGIVLAGLRLGTGSVAAPAAAHTVADLATWWL